MKPGFAPARRALVLIAAVAIIVVLSLSIHVVMLQVLWVPYPAPRGIGRWALLYPLAQGLGFVGLAAATAPALARLPVIRRWLLVALLFSAANGMVRNWLMAGIVTREFVAPAAGLVHTALLNLVLAALALAAVSRVRNLPGRILAGVALAAASLRLIGPAIGAALAPLLGWLAAHARPEVLLVPYGPDVLVPSYLAFAETVLACLALRYLVAFAPRRRDADGFWRYALLVLLVRGTLALAIWGPMIGAGPAAGVLSASQFVLQDLAMIALIQAVFVRWPDLLARSHAAGPRRLS